MVGVKDKPDFVVVGAPKCGTTTAYEYLRRHPDVYLPRKELHYFGSDLRFPGPRMGEVEYRSLFAPAGDRVTGDVSVWYLLSATAAKEIFTFAPEARIVVMLRNPVDLMYSLHGHALYNNSEFESDFARALELEPDRLAGRRLPRAPASYQTFLYRKAARLSEQIERYRDLFADTQIHYVLLDDLAVSPRDTVRDLYRFLGVADVDTDDVVAANTHAVSRSRPLARALTFIPRAVVPRSGLQALPRPLKDKAIAAWDRVRQMNRSESKRQPMDSRLREELLDEFSTEIDALEGILGRDLNEWRR